MPHRKNRKSTATRGFPDRQVIAKAEGRFAKADKQHASIEADPKRAVAHEQERVDRFKTTETTTAKAREIYTSSSGDRWFLAHDPESDRVYIKHVANTPSGGQQTDTEIDTFLSGERGSPEHRALVRLIGTLVEGDLGSSAPPRLVQRGPR
jgi:hypothetical protein